RNFPGVIDEVRIYNRALSATEVANLYTASKKIMKVNTSQNSKLITGLVGLWSFNGPDIGGNIAYDRSGQGNNGTIIGATLDSGKVGQALNFKGTTDIVSISDNAALDLTGPFTIASWIKATSQPGGWRNFVAKWAAGDDSLSAENSYYVAEEASGSGHVIKFRMEDSGGGTQIFGSTVLALNVWYHVTAVYDGSFMRIYVNGASDATPVSRTTGARDSATVFNVGNKTSNNSYGHPGPLDEVRVYNRALSADEIRRLYQMGK
ncbi:MAG: LamG-like jellyroll fold domain-containing protein, partial [Candidatus Shapirobacteria bacterium]